MRDSLFIIQVSNVKPREKFSNERTSHNKSLWKGVWGRTFLQKGSSPAVGDKSLTQKTS